MVTERYNITSADKNISIGPQTGPTSTTQAEEGQLYIDTSNHNTYQGVNSLIYGDQSTGNQDLTFNADVVISKSTTHSTGQFSRRWCDNFTWTTLRDIYLAWKKMEITN